MKFDGAILFSFFVFVLAARTLGQDASKTSPEPIKFAEFGKMSQAGVKEKMVAFRSKLHDDPTSQGYIINYGTPRAIAARRKQIVDSVTWLDLDPSRITFVDGTPEKTIRTVMWNVPPGAMPPVPK
jgi:hypothetical protein